MFKQESCRDGDADSGSGHGRAYFDTILSPVRRFIIGSGMFKADKMHIHHKLVEIGISTRKGCLYNLWDFCLPMCISLAVGES